MAELALVAVATFPSGQFQEHINFRTSKEVQKFLPIPTTKKEIPRSDSIHHRMTLTIHDPSNSKVWIPEPTHYVKLDSVFRRHVLIDVQETRPDLVLFSLGISEVFAAQQSVIRFLMPGPSEARRELIDFPLLSDLVGVEACKLYMHLHTTPLNCYNIWRDHYLRSLIYSKCEVYSKASPAEFLWDPSCSSNPTDKTDGLISFPGTRPEMKDLLSIVQEFYPSNSSSNLRDQSSLIPYFTRTETSEACENLHCSSSKVAATTVTPVERPKKVKLNSSPRTRNYMKAAKEREIYKRSSLHACESLLSLILDKRRRNTEVLSLVKSDTELPQLLSQFSAGIAGTGLAVLFSVGCKISGGKVPFCASKLLNTGVGLGLVWQSWAVNKLRDTVIYISKQTSKVAVKDREMIRRVDQNVNEMFFRAATVMVFAMLKFA